MNEGIRGGVGPKKLAQPRFHSGLGNPLKGLSFLFRQHHPRVRTTFGAICGGGRGIDGEIPSKKKNLYNFIFEGWVFKPSLQTSFHMGWRNRRSFGRLYHLGTGRPTFLSRTVPCDWGYLQSVIEPR